MRKESLHIAVDMEFVHQLLEAGRNFDLQRDGLYDARSGLINIWCSPDDKPACWDLKITRGGLSYPRDYVGALAWDWQADDRAALYVEATPYSLLERRPRRPLTEETWAEILAWLREKALGLIRLGRLQPRVTGTCCPFCEFVLPVGELINDLLAHISETHPAVRLRGLSLGGQPVLSTDLGEYPLQAKECFD